MLATAWFIQVPSGNRLDRDGDATPGNRRRDARIALRERNGQASNGIARPVRGMTGERAGADAFGQRAGPNAMDAKPVFGPGGAGCNGSPTPSGAVGKMQPQPRRDRGLRATEPTRGGRTTCPPGDRVDRRPDRDAGVPRGTKGSQGHRGGIAVLRNRPVPVTGQRALSGRWNARFRSPLPVRETMPAATIMRPSPGRASMRMATPGGWRKRRPPFGFGRDGTPFSLPLPASGERAILSPPSSRTCSGVHSASSPTL